MLVLARVSGDILAFHLGNVGFPHRHIFVDQGNVMCVGLAHEFAVADAQQAHGGTLGSPAYEAQFGALWTLKCRCDVAGAIFPVVIGVPGGAVIIEPPDHGIGIDLVAVGDDLQCQRLLGVRVVGVVGTRVFALKLDDAVGVAVANGAHQHRPSGRHAVFSLHLLDNGRRQGHLFLQRGRYHFHGLVALEVLVGDHHHAYRLIVVGHGTALERVSCTGRGNVQPAMQDARAKRLAVGVQEFLVDIFHAQHGFIVSHQIGVFRQVLAHPLLQHPRLVVVAVVVGFVIVNPVHHLHHSMAGVVQEHRWQVVVVAGLGAGRQRDHTDSQQRQ